METFIKIVGGLAMLWGSYKVGKAVGIYQATKDKELEKNDLESFVHDFRDEFDQTAKRAY